MIWILVVLAAIAATFARALAQEIVKREYGTWAAALGRLVARVAGVICPRHRHEWTNEVNHVRQLLGDEESLRLAFSFLVDAMEILLREGTGAWHQELPPPLRDVPKSARLPRVTKATVLLARRHRPITRHHHPHQLAGCCLPRVPDPIVVYQGANGLRVHHSSCPTLLRIRPERSPDDFIEATWVGEPKEYSLQKVNLRLPHVPKSQVAAVLKKAGWKLHGGRTEHPHNPARRPVHLTLEPLSHKSSEGAADKALRRLGADRVKFKRRKASVVIQRPGD